MRKSSGREFVQLAGVTATALMRIRTAGGQSAIPLQARADTRNRISNDKAPSV